MWLRFFILNLQNKIMWLIVFEIKFILKLNVFSIFSQLKHNFEIYVLVNLTVNQR